MTEEDVQEAAILVSHTLDTVRMLLTAAKEVQSERTRGSLYLIAWEQLRNLSTDLEKRDVALLDGIAAEHFGSGNDSDDEPDARSEA